MPLGRRKVTDRAKAAELQLGDLVLAKVKGFPAWPARPGHTSHGGKPGTLVRPNQKSTENDMPKGKLATSEGNPLHKASVDCRGDHFQFGAIKRKMAGNGDSPLAKKGSIFNDGRGNISKSYSKGESSHFMAEKKNSRNPIIMRSGSVRADNNITSTAEPHDNMRLSRLMKPCKGSGGVSKSSSTGTADLTKKSISGTNGINFKHKLPFNRVPPSRRALRFVEDDDDGEDRKTPIHSVTTGILLRDYSGTFDSERKYHMRPESYRDSQNASLSNTGIVFIGNVSSRIEERTNNFTDIMETMDSSASRPFNFEEQVLKSSANLLAGPNSMKQEKCKTAGSNSRAANNELETLVYPGNADNLVCFKALKRQVKGANFYNAQFGDSCKAFGTTNLSRSSSIAEKSKQFLEKSKVMPKSSIPITVITENRSNVNISAGCYTEKDVSAGQRSDIMREATSTDSTDSKVTDSTVSMRHLIAAAQAKRRQAHSHQLLDGSGTPGSSLTPQCIHGRSPNLISTMQIFPSGDPFQDKKLFQTYVPSEPPLVSGQFLPVKQGEHEDYDRRPSTGNWLPTDSSSGSSEAEVARDALEGMIETLSRTRDSIGRATRHAIDCAKHGIANEVVELLIRKLEGEPSLSRRIDLFFLVDSITQCSHTQKGIAGASYVPVVQAALPRLLGAAAPTGASAHENRRQCLKVLRLWLERRILPEYFLRHYMDEIEVRNDGLNSRFSIGIPSFAERSVDDPIREMKNLLVDEYGSNTTFLFPGILSAHVLDGDEDFQSSPCNGTVDCSPIEACGVSEVLLGSEDRPMEAHHHILEHIENEIEMEDAITISPDERSTGGNFSCSIAPTHQEYYWVVKSTCGIQDKLLFLPAGYPPLPLDPPPTPPPLPSSPPPPAPSPPYSPQPLPLPQSLLTTPPPSPLSLPSELSAIISLTQSPFPSSPCRYTCCPPLLQEYCWMANDKQLRQPIGNNSIEYAITVGVKNEVVMQQSPNFMAHGISNSKKLSQQRGESIQLMHSHPALRAEKFLNHPLPSSQISSQHLSHAKSICQQHIQQKYNPNSSAFLHGQMNYGAEEQWRSHPSDTDQHYSSAWNMGGKTPSCSSASFVQDGYCRLTMERADSTSTDFHPPHYSAPSQASLPGHSFPNSSGTDIWRPS